MTEKNNKLWENSGLDYSEPHHEKIAKKAFFRGLEMAHENPGKYDPPVKKDNSTTELTTMESMRRIVAERKRAEEK